MPQRSKASLKSKTTVPPRRSGPEDGPRAVDLHVGRRLRLRRTILGMSQEKLGTAIGLTFQQVQKYERGSNRMGSSRLYEIAQALDVPISYFFEDLGDVLPGERHAASAAASSSEQPMNREVLELARAFGRIEDERVRKRVLELAKALGRSASEE